ncbi:hypothetical protein O6H91_10G006200 [Diphasiastrum complanatum]|uniref:Uncharacterized protein n=1 Tax=Diphasiastrum complanatum TaxID=34168 RepID=A0ACC2CE13_DIPCM|nr:hypothetical protein O6H91_10G006200 [Diphasiastrum complanatum]
MFIGYSMTSYGYKCLDCKTNKVVVSSNVVFKDHVMFNYENCNKPQPVFIEDNRLVPNPVQLGDNLRKHLQLWRSNTLRMLPLNIYVRSNMRWLEVLRQEPESHLQSN